jgi:hypothetical protein
MSCCAPWAAVQSRMYLARKAEPKASKLLFKKEVEQMQKRHR